jgi:small subunit ribosomal protein S16
MAVVVRLARHGTRNRPFYHVVAADHRMRRDGRFIEKLGIYDPNQNPSFFECKEDRVQFWYGQGAELSATVAKLLKIKKISIARNKAAKTKKPAK